MRVLWVTFAAPDVGAVELGTVEAARELAARGHDVHVQVPGPGPVVGLLDGAATVHVVPHNPWVVRGVGATTRWLGYNALIAVRATVSLMNTLSPDVIVTETILYPTAAIAAHIRRLPHVWFVHALPQAEHTFPRLLLGTALTMRLVGRLSSLVLCVSDAVRMEASQWIPADRMRVVRPAAEVQSVEPAARPNAAFRLILLGHKSPGKGQREALRALSLLRERGRDVELDLVGGSASGYEPELIQLASTLGVVDHVRFLPHSRDGLALMSAADVALVCSRRDAYPRVTIEAMRLGVPVIAAADYGLLEAVDNGRTGLLYPPGDISALAERIEFLQHNPSIARQLAENARGWAGDIFSAARLGDELEAVFASVTHRR